MLWKAASAFLFCLLIVFPNPGRAQNVDPGIAQNAAPDTLMRGQNQVDANAGTVSIITIRNLGGPFMIAALDLSTLLDAGERFEEMRVVPVIARGKVQNLWDVLYLKNIDIGFVQTDVLEYLKDDPRINSVKRRIRYISVMFPEEVHIVARKDIRSLRDLEGQTVSINAKGTGSSVVGTLLFKRLGIRATLIHEDTRRAIARMKAGEIAAHFNVLGKPARPVARLKKGDGLHLLPIPYLEELQGVYFPSSFTSKDYPELIPPGTEVPTIAAGNVLAVFNWNKDHPRYKKVERFVNAFFSRFEELKQPGFYHGWKNVNLSATVPGWKRFPAAQEWLDKNPISPTPAGAAVENGNFTSQAGAPGKVITLAPKGAIRPTATWSLGTRVGDYVYAAGMRGIDPQKNALVPDDEGRVRQAFANMKLVAESGGAKLTDAVRLVVYVTDMYRHRPIVNKLQKELWGNGPYPPRTIIEVDRLNQDDIVEIEGTFYAPKDSADGKVEHLAPPGAIKPTATWGLGVRAGDHVYVAGMRGIDPQKNALVPGDEGRVRQAFANMEMIARAGGAKLTDATRLVVFVTDMYRYRPIVNKLQRELWGDGPYPPRTIIEVDRLNQDDIVEIQGTFYAPRGVRNTVGILSPFGAIKPTATWGLGATAGDHTYVAGMRGIDPQKNALVPNDEGRVRQAFANMKLIVEAGGSELTNAARLVVFVTDMYRYRPIVNKLQKEIWGDGPYPPRTIIEVDRLNQDDIVEIEGTFLRGK